MIDENEMLKLELKKREKDNGKFSDDIASEVEAERAAGQEAPLKLGYVMRQTRIARE